jgi:signal transduction histidine kinase
MKQSQVQRIQVNPEVQARAAVLLAEHEHAIWTRTDKLFGRLLLFEWVASIALAMIRVPYIWDAQLHRVHQHVWMAVVFGGMFSIFPVALASSLPGRAITRHVIAASQLLMSALFIHVGDGRIEMHFHVFGSLAFLAFYRDWRVLITATIVVLLDHVLRSIYLPQSVFGVLNPNIWRAFEHAGWVVFEDIFLISSCLQGASEMRGIAENRALLELSYRDVENKVIERTQQLKDAQADLMKVARSAGVAEVATSVLHNVGNVLNSVNVSANVLTDHLRRSELPNLSRVGQILDEHQLDLPQFLSTDERGKMIPGFIKELASCLDEEHRQIVSEISSLAAGIDHIKQIVAAQQTLAKRVNIDTPAEPAKLMETALVMQGIASRTDIAVIRRFASIPPVKLDQHKVLQILINLISNASQSVSVANPSHKQIVLNVSCDDAADCKMVRFIVTDNGSGIAPENLARIFSHGFTTKATGHGFGLHSAANAAQEMGGSLTAASDGLGMGASFTLQIPIAPVLAESPCNQ